MKNAKAIPQIDAILREVTASGDIPGAVILIGRGEDTYMHEAYGFAQLLPSPDPMTRDTHFDLASVSKLVGTWASLMPLLQTGALRLGDTLAGLLDRPMHPQNREVSVWNLLTHTGGFVSSRHTADLGGTRRERIDALLALAPEYPRGTRVRYSDLSFICLGEIVAAKTGVPLDEAAGRVWRVLGMTETCYNPPEGTYCAATEIKRGVLRRGQVHDEVSTELGGVAGHAGVFSTAKDLQKFCAAILPQTRNPFFSEAWLNLSYRNQTAYLGEDRALGWIAYAERPEGGIRGHTGFTGTSLWLDLSCGEYVVLLTNRVHPSRELHDMAPVRRRIYETLYEIPYV